MDQNLERVMLAGGIVAPLLLFVGILVASAVYPGYSHTTQFISTLGASGAPAAWIMDSVLIISGFLVVAFSIALHSKFGEVSVIGPLMIAVAGITMALSGVFVCDSACDSVTTISTIHNILARAIGITFVFGILFTAPLFKNIVVFVYSIATMLVVLMFGVVLLFSLYPIELESVIAVVEKTPLSLLLQLPQGITQRITMGLPLLWIFLVALYMRRK